MRVSVKGVEEVEKLLDELPPEQYAAARKVFNRSALKIQSIMAGRIRNGSPLHSRTGNLRRSFRFSVGGNTLESLTTSVYTNSIYAPVQEGDDGRPITIRAKDAYRNLPGGPYLNIPTRENKTAAGVMRRDARAVFDSGGYIVPFKRGGYGIMANGVLMFTLHQEVTIPPRLGFADTVNDQVPEILKGLQELL